MRKGIFIVGFWILLIGAVIALGVLASCSQPAVVKQAPIAAAYVDHTPAAGAAVTTQQAAVVQVASGIGTALTQNADARIALHDAWDQLTGFLTSLPPSTPPPAPVVTARGDIKTADDRLALQVTTLQSAKDKADATIHSQAETIGVLAAQVGENKALREESVANAGRLNTQAAVLAKWEAQDRDIFGRMRHWWNVAKWTMLFFLIVAVVVGYLGVRYGADKLTAPVFTGIGSILGYMGHLVKVAGYYVGTAIFSLIPGVGHFIDEHITHLNTVEKKVETLSGAHNAPPSI